MSVKSHLYAILIITFIVGCLWFIVIASEEVTKIIEYIMIGTACLVIYLAVYFAVNDPINKDKKC